MKLLLLGSGGREHALAWKIAQSPKIEKLYIAPGNAGTSEVGENVAIKADDFAAIKEFVVKNDINMVVVGLEDPLVKGIYDYFKNDEALKNVPVIGPSKAGAVLEGSKEFAKGFMQRHHIPTAGYKSITAANLEEGLAFLETLEAPYVLKADGLCAGKGVLILPTLEEAKKELKEMLSGMFGDASATVVIEEFLSGIECSVFVLTDGKNYKILPEAKDYKRIGEGDKGLNTGGMGSISPVPFADKEWMQKVEDRTGVSYTLAERNNFYLSFAVAQKEPTRSDFTDRYKFAADDTYPSSEKLYDWELGYQYTAPRLSLGVNLYYMKYKDQLVPTGMVNDDSNALNTNVPDSYRRGVELSASWRATGWFTVGANASFSQNRIENYVDALKDSPTYGKELGDMTIAYSPDVIANAFLNFHHRGFEAVFHTQHVGKQYFTNNENDALSLDAYCVTNLNLAYTFRTRSARSVRLGLLINNLFNAEYESNGYGYSYMDTWSGPAPVRIDEAYYFPQAPLNVLANVTVKF